MRGLPFLSHTVEPGCDKMGARPSNFYNSLSGKFSDVELALVLFVSPFLCSSALLKVCGLPLKENRAN